MAGALGMLMWYALRPASSEVHELACVRRVLPADDDDRVHMLRQLARGVRRFTVTGQTVWNTFVHGRSRDVRESSWNATGLRRREHARRFIGRFYHLPCLDDVAAGASPAGDDPEVGRSQDADLSPRRELLVKRAREDERQVRRALEAFASIFARSRRDRARG